MLIIIWLQPIITYVTSIYTDVVVSELLDLDIYSQKMYLLYFASGWRLTLDDSPADKELKLSMSKPGINLHHFRSRNRRTNANQLKSVWAAAKGVFVCFTSNGEEYEENMKKILVKNVIHDLILNHDRLKLSRILPYPSKIVTDHKTCQE